MKEPLVTYQVQIRVMPRPALLDPQGQAVEHALAALGFRDVQAVRVGKALLVSVAATSSEEARERAQAMCRRLLANPVTEDFEVVVGAAT
jgi:phosphoribosylformylglycinamidine synthase subunit PurS